MCVVLPSHKEEDGKGVVEEVVEVAREPVGRDDERAAEFQLESQGSGSQGCQ